MTFETNPISPFRKTTTPSLNKSNSVHSKILELVIGSFKTIVSAGGKGKKRRAWKLIQETLQTADLKDLSEQQSRSLKASIVSAHFFFENAPERMVVFLKTMMAARLPEDLIISTIASRRIDRWLINRFDIENQTLLHFSIKYGYPQIADHLLSVGIDPYLFDRSRNTAMHYLDIRGEQASQFIGIFKKYDIKLNQVSPTNSTLFDQLIETRPDLACHYLNRTMVSFFTPQHWFESLLLEMNQGFFYEMIRKKANLPSWTAPFAQERVNQIRDAFGNGLLHYAAKTPGSISRIEQLVKIGISPNSINIAGATPLFEIEDSSADKAIALLKMGANPDIKDAIGRYFFQVLLTKKQGKDLLIDLLERHAFNIRFKEEFNQLISGLYNLESALLKEHAAENSVTEEEILSLIKTIALLSLNQTLPNMTEKSDFKSSQNQFLNHDTYTQTSHFSSEITSNILFNFERKKGILDFKNWKALEKFLFEKIIEKVLYRKFLGNVLKIKNSPSFDYEGLYPPDIPKMKKEIWKGIQQSFPHLKLDPAEKKFLIQICQDNIGEIDSDRLFSSIKQGRFTIIATGYETHCANIVFWNDYFIICNRGDRPKINSNSESLVSTILAYKICKTKVTNSIINKIISIANETTPAQFYEFIYSELPVTLTATESKSEKDELCKAIEAFSPKGQSVGNCPVASEKTAAFVGFVLMTYWTGSLKSDMKERLAHGKAQFKIAWAVVRAHFTELDLSLPDQDLNPEIVRIAMQKIKKHLNSNQLSQNEVLRFFPRVNTHPFFDRIIRSSFQNRQKS